jgi:hypothetical protein
MMIAVTGLADVKVKYAQSQAKESGGSTRREILTYTPQNPGLKKNFAMSTANLRTHKSLNRAFIF